MPRGKAAQRPRGWQQALASIWTSRGTAGWMLWPLSLLFGVIVFSRRLLFRLHVFGSERLPVPVIVVGNIVAGGSGKTPLVLWIADWLRAQGWRPGVVSRGHGGAIAARRDAPAEVHSTSDPREVGDEPLLLARRAGCPVWVGRDRVSAARRLLAQHPQCNVLVLDDGLQHYRLCRDIEIAVVDGRGFGNGWMQPAGPLREPVSRLASVDAVMLNGDVAAHGMPPGMATADRFSMHLRGRALVRLTDPSHAVDVSALGSVSVHAVAGIGDPSRFFRHLEALGLEVIAHPFADHHMFHAMELEFGDDLPVLMTEKDAVKCAPFAQPRFWMLPVCAEPDPAFGDFLLGRLHGPKTA